MNLIKTNFGFDSTTEDVIRRIDLSKLRAVVLGGTPGNTQNSKNFGSSI